MTATNINFRVRPLYDQNQNVASKETLTEMDQTARDMLFRGDSIEKKQLIEAQEQARLMKAARRAQKKLER